jgi:hypothetical protein
MSKLDRNLETISAYLDGELTTNERERFEHQLKKDDSLQNLYQDLKRARSVLRNAPKLRAPRNYILTPEMVGIEVRQSRAFPLFRFASAFAAFLLVLLFLGDIFVLPGMMSAPSRAIQVAESLQLEEPAPEMETDMFASQPPAAAEPAVEEMPAEGAPAEGDNLSPPMESPSAVEKLLPTLIPGASEAEQSLLAGVTETPEEELMIASSEQSDFPILESGQGFNLRYYVRIAEYSLLIIAIATGITAFYLYRRISRK